MKVSRNKYSSSPAHHVLSTLHAETATPTWVFVQEMLTYLGFYDTYLSRSSPNVSLNIAGVFKASMTPGAPPFALGVGSCVYAHIPCFFLTLSVLNSKFPSAESARTLPPWLWSWCDAGPCNNMRQIQCLWSAGYLKLSSPSPVTHRPPTSCWTDLSPVCISPTLPQLT
jgi:hypothetical protein